VINKGLYETVLIDSDLAGALVEIVIDIAGLELSLPEESSQAVSFPVKQTVLK
jgi:hypothetical protein